MSSPLPVLSPRTENGDSKTFRKGSLVQKPYDTGPPTLPGELVARGTRNNPFEPVLFGRGGSSQTLGWLKEESGRKEKGRGWRERRLKDDEILWLWKGPEKVGLVIPRKIQNTS